MLPEGFRIERVDAAFAPTLSRLFELYLHDMAEWFRYDSDSDGRYGYPVADCWNDGGAVFVPYAGEVPVGFAVVTRAASSVATDCRDVKEFFVVRRHRHSGVADALARHVWDQYPGPWQVRVYRGNLPALPFWRRVIRAYSGGACREEERVAYEKRWIYFSFSSSGAG